jgi:hypothetical protein
MDQWMDGWHVGGGGGGRGLIIYLVFDGIPCYSTSSEARREMESRTRRGLVDSWRRENLS